MNRSAGVESLAIVVALTDPATPLLEASLARFAEEAGPLGEVWLVDASGGPSGEERSRRFANVRVIRRPVGSLAPELWREGLLATVAPFVAFSTAQMIPRRGWLASLKAKLIETGAAGVGGPIEPGSDLSITDRAVALLRYSGYFPAPTDPASPPFSSPLPLGEGPGVRGVAPPETWELALETLTRPATCPHPGPLPEGEGARKGLASFAGKAVVGPTEPPGDNALYRRDRLMDVQSSWVDGFWEVDVHKALRDRGESLAMAGSAVVGFGGGIRLASMIRQRMAHARRYGAGRSRGLSPLARLVRVAACPLVPFVLCGRIIKALKARKMNLKPWLPALPSLMVLASAWALGEAVGTWRGPKSVDETAPPATDPVSTDRTDVPVTQLA